MLKKIGKIGLALVLVIGLLPMMSLRAYAAIPSFTEKADFVIEPPATIASGKSVSDADGLPNGNTAVILSTFNYVGNSYVYTHFLKVYDSTGMLITDINLSSLMDTYYKMTDVNMLALSDGNLLITYNKSDSGDNNLQLGTVTENTPNAYFMVLNQLGQKVTAQTQINTFSAASTPALTRFISIAELSDGNIAFSWQRNDNISTATRVFTATGTPVSNETLLVNYNASMSYVSAGDGVYMVAYNSGASADYMYLKLFSNSGALLKQIDLGARTGEKQLFLSTLGNGNFMFSQYNWITGSSEVSLYDNDGTSQGGFTVNGYLGEASAAVYKNGAMPGFVTVSTDPTSNAAINDAYNIGTEWSGTQYAYLNYYDYEGNLVSSPNQSVDSAPVVFEGYDEDTWMFDVEYYPKFSLYPAFGDKVVFIKTDNTDASHYRITGKLFEAGAATPVALQSAVADGVSGTTTSTKIDLTFDTAIAGLTADDITITDGTGSAVKGTLSGSGTQWSIALASVTTEGTVSVAVNSPSGYTISGSPMVVTVSLFTAAPEATPAASIDYAAEQLTGLTPNGTYTINGTVSVTATADGKLGIDSSWLGTSLSIVKQGNGSTTIDSAAQTLSVPGRPAAPAGVAATNETAISANNGTLTNVTTAMEYKKSAAGAWTAVAGTTVTGLAPDTYDVRTKATSTAFASEAQSVTVLAYVAAPETTPAASIDYAAEQLTGLTPSASYTVNSTPVTATAEGKLSIDSSWLGTSLSIVKQGNNSTTVDSAAQTLSVPGRPAAPAGVAATNETAISANNGTLTNVTTAMEYRKGAAGAWTNVAGTTVTGLAPDTYDVRTKATSTAFASEAQSVTVLAYVALPEATPAASIDYAAEQLTGLTPNGTYTINGTVSVTATADGKLGIDSSWLGTSLSIVKQGNGSTTIDSAAQTLSVPGRPAAPAGVGATDETAISANNGTLTNVTTSMEYKKSSAGVWTAVAGTTVTGLTPDTYDVRTKATSTAFASEAQSVTVVAYVAVPEATPAASIDYAAEQLTGLTPSGTYTINGTLSVTATADGKLGIDSSWLGTSLSIVKQGNGSTTVDSAAQTLSVPGRPAAPAGVAATDETAISANNGTLTNVTTAMEYKKSSAGVWTDVAGTTVTGLTPDTYDVRTKATSTAFASEAQSVTVVAYVAVPEATPAASIDYAAEQLMGLTPSGTYTINGTLSVTATADGKLGIDSSWLGTSLSIVKPGNGSTTIDSAAQTLSVPGRPAAPAGVGATDETAISANNGTLTNVTTAMEYKKSAAGAWTAVAGTTVTGLAPDTYDVRTKATSTAFASEAQRLTVVSFTANAEATPAASIDYAAEELTGLTPNGSYTINGTVSVTATADGKLAIDSSWLGTSLSIVKQGNAATTTDSAAQTLNLPSRPAAPVGVSVTDVTYNGANDGTLQNLTVQMEYRAGSTGLWTDVTDTIITGLAPDIYYVREKATATAFASIAALVTVHDSSAVIPSAPDVAADDQNNTIAGLDTSMEFSVDDGPYVRYNGTNLPDLSGDHTVKVRVAASGSVPAGPGTTLTFTINVLNPAGELTVSASDPGGAANNGYTQINVTPVPAEGHKLLYKNFGAGSVVVPNAGDSLTGYTLVGSDGLIPTANGDRIGVAEVDADGKVLKFGSVAAVVVAADPVTPDPDPVSPGTGGNPNSGTTAGNTASNVTDVIVLVNGKQENAGKATTTTSGNLRTTTIAVDPDRLKAKLDAEGNGAIVTIPMMLDSNIIVGELNGQMIKNMQNVSATLVLQTSKGTYTLTASEINIDALSARLGNGLKLEDIVLRITIGETPSSMNQIVTAAADRGGFTLIAPSLDFTVTATSGTSTVEVSRFNAYVERTVALPDGIDPNRITTGIVVDPDGTVRHVPTRLIQKDGRYYADIKSLTNSSYAVVWHPLTFADVENHWAKDAVNDMGSRLVINGVNETTFNPNADITRAEFAAIIVRGLGLKLGEGRTAFADVPANSWYAAAVETASEYGLITGFEDGTFQPDAPITREQAMNIIAKAMKLTGLAGQTGTVDTASVLEAFTDAGSVGVWAKDSLALAAKAGLISGRGGNKLEAKANVTRAEVAALIQRLLQKSDLID